MSPKSGVGAYTTRFSNLKFVDVDRRVNFMGPRKGIFHDLDGTLTERGPDSYVSAYWPHNEWPECEVNLDVYTGIICPAPFAF